MNVNRIILPVCGTNCYLVINEKNNEAVVIDPGSAAERIIEKIDATGAKPVAVLLTHGHFDHAGESAEICKHYDIKAYAYIGEKDTLESPEVNLSFGMFGQSEVYHADVYMKDEEEVDLAGFHIRCLATPGHTPGGCCFYFPYEQTLFTGDTLFCCSVGRTDFPGGSMSQLVNSIREKLMTLPGNTKCFPGHEGPTTIEDERVNNPFL